MDLKLWDRMRTRFAGSHSADEEDVGLGLEANAKIFRSVALIFRKVDVGVVGRVVVGHHIHRQVVNPSRCG
jgi:hypothetical protein